MKPCILIDLLLSSLLLIVSIVTLCKSQHSGYQKEKLRYPFPLRKKCSYSELFWSAFFLHFPVFGLNTKRYSISLRIRSECRKKSFLQLLFGCPTANFGPLSRGQTHSPDVNHCVLRLRPEGHREPCSEVESLSPAERLVGFEPGTFRFLLQRSNPLGHSPGKIRTRITATPNTDTFYAVAFTKLK